MEQLIGLIPVEIKQEYDEITFKFSNGAIARWYHQQDCCEIVTIEDVNGDWDDLLGHPLLVAEEREGSDPEGFEPSDDSRTWTFYTFRSIKGSVDVRWLGESNGYYSESVDFSFQEPKQ
jgi:hypothetical protein